MTFKLELEKIVGKERHRTDPRTGRNYTPKQTRLAEEAVRKAYRAEHEDHGDFDGIVTVAIETFRPLAKSNPKYWAGRADLGKPDWDNIGKLVCDALNGVAYTDDAHVVIGGVQKGCRTPYGTPPLAKVCITHFTEEYIKEKKKRTTSTSTPTSSRNSRRTTSTRRCSSTPPASRATSCSMRPTPTTPAA